MPSNIPYMITFECLPTFLGAPDFSARLTSKAFITPLTSAFSAFPLGKGAIDPHLYDGGIRGTHGKRIGQ